MNTEFPDQVYARTRLVKYLEDHADTAQISCLLTLSVSGVTVIHDFTTDPLVLVEALQWTKKNGKSLTTVNALSTFPQAAFPSGNPGTEGTPNSLRASQLAMQNEASRIQALKAAAKVDKLYGDDLIETTLKSLTQIARSAAGIPGRKALIWISSAFPDFRPDMDRPPRIGELYREMWTAMGEAQMSVYPVDAPGAV